MKKIILILFSTCFTVQFSLAQEQARLTVAPLDSNVTCAKATVIPHTFNNEFLVDSFANKGNAYYTFTATAKSGKIKVLTNDIIWIYVYGDCSFSFSNQFLYTKGYKTLVTGTIENLIIGAKYIIELSTSTRKTKIKVASIANKKDDNVASTPTSISGIPYNFNLADYTKGRENMYGNNCSTTKADSNVVNVFVKFKATSTSATLDLNLNNASLESRLGLTSAPKTCQPIQKNKNLRTDTFTGLTIGNEYTVRIEIGGDAALGYARTATANNASITLVGGTTTGIETASQPTFSIAPNPSNGNFSFISDENADLEISDLLGAKVSILQNVSPNQNIDLQLAKGIYLLKVTNTKGSKIEKLVIE